MGKYLPLLLLLALCIFHAHTAESINTEMYSPTYLATTNSKTISPQHQGYCKMLPNSHPNIVPAAQPAGTNDQQLQFGTFQNTNQPGNQPSPSVTSTQQQFSNAPQSNVQTTNQQGSNPQVPTEPPQPAAPKILLNEIGQPILGKGFKIDNGISYQRLNVKNLQNKYLFFDLKLAESDKWQQVNMTITVDGTQMVVAECLYDGQDSCFISKNSLKDNEILFITVKCQDQCTYNLNTRWSDIEHMKPGDDYVFKFGKETSQIYHVELGDTDFEEFRVHVAPRATLRPFENIKIYGKYGKDNPSPEDYDFKSTNLWEDGEGLFLSKNKMKEKNMYLLLVGQPDTTYRMTCKLITSSNHVITNGEHIYEYLQAGNSKSYHISGFNTQKYEQFSLRLSVLSGYVQIDYYFDKELTKKLPFEPFKYMDDSEYIFDAKQITQFASTGVFLKITSKQQDGQEARDSTYTIKFNGRRKEDGVELNEHVYGFIALKEQRFGYFNFKKWISETEVNSNLKFTVSTLHVLGKVNPEFRICQSTISECTDPATYINSTRAIESGTHDLIGEKQIYELEIKEKDLQNINSAQRQGIIIVNLKAEGSDQNSLGFSLIAVQFVNNNKVLYLRQDRPLEQKLRATEMKLYKYINSDTNVKEIRVHVNEISGIVKVNGAIKNPDNNQIINVQPEANTLRFVNNLTSPIIVSVKADTRAIFGISMQIILKNQVNGDADVIAIGEDLSYTVRIKPQAYTVFEITPMFYNSAFSYESTQSIIACALNMKTGKCIDVKDKTTIPKLSYKGTITEVSLSSDRKGRIKITNPFSDSVAEVTVIYHSRQIDRCTRKSIGKVYSQNVNNGTCYSYLIQEEQLTGLEIYISKREFSNMQYSVFVCGNSISNANREKSLILRPDVIKNRCQNTIESKQVAILWDVNTVNAGNVVSDVKVDFVVQKLGGMVMLPEGVSYSIIELSRNGPLRTFGYSIINKRDTKIFIRQTIGKFKAYARIINEADRQTEKTSQSNYQFSSITTLDYSQDPIIAIPRKALEEATCNSCAIIIAVYSADAPGKTVEFEIEVVQLFESLSDDRSVNGYLEAGSYGYYYYVSKAAKETTLIFFLSDHNQQCANIYLSFLENPGPKNFLAQAFQSNELIYTHRGPGMKYFLAVEAVRTCDFALSVLQVDYSIHRLERGKQNMLKLLKGKTRFFTFQQYTNEPFKIISLSKFGEVRLYLNASKQSPNKNTWTTNQLDISTFSMKSEHSNTLSVTTQDKIFCNKCYYFVAAEALTPTFSTLFLVYPDTVVPLLKNKFFSDYFLKKGDATLASYSSIEKSKIQVTVHSGSIEISANYKEYKTIQTFSAKSDIQTMLIDISENAIPAAPTPQKPDKYNLKQRIPVNFVFKALSDKTSYTLEIKSIAQKGQLQGYAEYQNILAGEPNHVTISNSKVLCIDGHLRDKNEEILIAVNSDNQALLSNIIFNPKLRHNDTSNISKQIHKNVLTLKLIDTHPELTSKYSDNYQICMKIDTVEMEEKEEKEESKLTEEEKEKIVDSDSTQNATEFEEQKEITLKAVITQINSVNIIPSDTDSVVKGQNTFVIHSDGQFLLDVFECKGEAKVSYSDSLAQLETQKYKMLESVGISEQKHAVKISQKDMTFVKISSEHAVVRWLPLNFETDEGVGYMRFSAGDMHYNSQFKYMNVQFQPLQWVKKTKSTVESIHYLLYISNDTDKLDYAVQCDPDSSNDVVWIELGKIQFTGFIQKQKDFQSYKIEKSFLENRFNGSDNIYINIVAKMVLKLSPKVEKDPRFTSSIADQHEHYRFIYNRQQMPLETYKPSQIESIPDHFLIMIVGSIVLVLLLCTYLFTQKIAPMIARIRSRALIEEAQQPPPPANKDDLQAVPPSSDRNQRVAEIQVETDQKMSS